MLYPLKPLRALKDQAGTFADDVMPVRVSYILTDHDTCIVIPRGHPVIHLSASHKVLPGYRRQQLTAVTLPSPPSEGTF